MKLWAHSPKLYNLGMTDLQSMQRQEDQKFKVIVGHMRLSQKNKTNKSLTSLEIEKHFRWKPFVL